jgi:hypothetical protein
LLWAGLARPLGRPGKKVRCLQLQCSRKQAHTFLRGGRWSTSQASKTFTVARMGPQRSPVYEHLPRSFGFGGTDSLPIITRPEEPPEVKPVEVLTAAVKTPDVATCEQLPAVTTNVRTCGHELLSQPVEASSSECIPGYTEQTLQVIPDEGGTRKRNRRGSQLSLRPQMLRCLPSDYSITENTIPRVLLHPSPSWKPSCMTSQRFASLARRCWYEPSKTPGLTARLASGSKRHYSRCSRFGVRSRVWIASESGNELLS